MSPTPILPSTGEAQSHLKEGSVLLEITSLTLWAYKKEKEGSWGKGGDWGKHFNKLPTSALPLKKK